MELVFIFFVWLALGAATAYLANLRGRDPLVWSMVILTMSLFGLPFAVMGMALLYFLPSIDDDEDVPEMHEFEELLPEPPPVLTPDEMAMCEWFFYDQAKVRHGPVSFQEMRSAWSMGHLKGDSYVWTESFDVWKRVSDVPELGDALRSIPMRTLEDLDRPI